MFVHYRTQGVFLKKENRGEADQLFTVYTKDFGKLKVLGRAIRKIKSKLRPGADIFCLSEIEFIQGKTYKVLIDAVLIEKFKNIRSNLTRLFLAKKTLRFLDNLLVGQEVDERTWRLLNEALFLFNNLRLRQESCRSFYYYFVWNFLAVLGYKPEIYNCSLCHEKLKDEKLYFVSQEGGAICQKCSKSVELKIETSSEIVKILRVILRQDKNLFLRLKIKKEHLLSLEKITKDYLKYL